MEPGGVDDQRVAPPALGQVAAERVDVSARGRRRSSSRRSAGSVTPSQSAEPLGVDRGDGPEAQAVQEPGAGDALGVGVARLAGEPPGGAG